MESLGEMKGKKSYRRDTVVLALPGLAEEMGKGAWTRSNRSEAQRDAPMPFNPSTLQQARGTKTGDRIGYPH